MSVLLGNSGTVNDGTTLTIDASDLTLTSGDELNLAGRFIVYFEQGADWVFTSEQPYSSGSAASILIGRKPDFSFDNQGDDLDDYSLAFDGVWIGENHKGLKATFTDGGEISFSTDSEAEIHTGAYNTWSCRPLASYYKACYESFFETNEHRPYLGFGITGLTLWTHGGSVRYELTDLSKIKSSNTSVVTITDSVSSEKISCLPINTIFWNGCTPEIEKCGVDWISTDKTNYLCEADTGKWYYKIKPLTYAPVYARIVYDGAIAPYWLSSNNFGDYSQPVEAEGYFSTSAPSPGTYTPQIYTNVCNNFYGNAYNASRACWHFTDIGTYAINAFVEPKILSIDAERVTSDTYEDTLAGTVSWLCDALSPSYRTNPCTGKGTITNSKTGNTVSSFTFDCGNATGGEVTTSFADSTILAAGTPYMLTLTVESSVDASGTSTHATTATFTLPTAFFLMDFDGTGGKAIGIGQEAVEGATGTSDNGQLDISMDTKLHAPVTMDSTLTVGGAISAPYLVGSIQMYGGATAPSGWLLCDGSAISRTTYAALFNVIGTAYGEGDGSTTFNVPNFSGRFPIGHCNTAPSTNSASCGYQGGSNPYPRSSSTVGWFGLGESGGEDSHVLTTAEMPSHNHGTGSSNWPAFLITSPNGDVVRATVKSGSGTNNLLQSPNSCNNDRTTTSSSGSGNAHTQLPPFLGVNYIIYAG